MACKLVLSILDTSVSDFMKSMKSGYITNVIDKEYMSIKETYTVNNDYTSEQPDVKEKIIDSLNEINPFIFYEIINHLPDSSIADITFLIENLHSLEKKERDAWGQRYIMTNFNFYITNTDASCGTLTFYFKMINYDEFGILDFLDAIEITMKNVIYKNHKYYYITKELIKWLNVDNKPKRKKALELLFV